MSDETGFPLAGDVLTPREMFHFLHGGWCTPPGREECARRAAAAEEKMEAAGWTWAVDWDPYAEREEGYEGTYSGVFLVDEEGMPDYRFAIWGIDTASAEGDYGRTVAAGLAMEADREGVFDAGRE